MLEDEAEGQHTADALLAFVLDVVDDNRQRPSVHFLTLPSVLNDPSYFRTIAVPQTLNALRGVSLDTLWAGLERVCVTAHHYYAADTPAHVAALVLEQKARQKYLELTGRSAPLFTLEERHIFCSVEARCMADPRFLAVVSFWLMFGGELPLPQLDFHQLATMLCNPLAHMAMLRAVHVPLLRRIGKTIADAKYPALACACHWLSAHRGVLGARRWPQQLCRAFSPRGATVAYFDLTVRDRLGVLESLQLAQFDDNVAVQKTVHEMSPENLRPSPLGGDILGNRYWLVFDAVECLLFYKELPSLELECLAKTSDELETQAVVLEVELSEAPSLVHSDAGCSVCRSSRHPDQILLCDGCDRGVHLDCLCPPLEVIPEGDWLCPWCRHAQLVAALHAQCALLARKREAVERARSRLQRGGVNVANIVALGGAGDTSDRPRRCRKAVNYADMVLSCPDDVNE